MTTYAFVFARGGSKGVPRKNLRMLSGKPLIAYAIGTGLRCPSIDRVLVSTDDEEIAGVGKEFGAEVPFMRPRELAEDDSPEWLAWRHAIRQVAKSPGSPKMQAFVALPPTAPLRSSEDVERCISVFREGGADIVITVKKAHRHPSFNMVNVDRHGRAKLVIPPEKVLHRRQDAVGVYDMTTVAYVARPDFVLSADSIFEGVVKAVVIPEERALDIDSEMDLSLAELLLQKRGDSLEPDEKH